MPYYPLPTVYLKKFLKKSKISLAFILAITDNDRQGYVSQNLRVNIMNEQDGQKDKKMAKTKEHKRAKYKPRSPRYPCIGLREAVKNARALYEKEGKAFVAKEIAVKVWGYNRLHGRSLTILAAMAQYGLIRYQKGKVGISEDAFIIIEAPHNSLERKKALERCAKSPTIFDELYQSYTENLPSDDALIWSLKQRGFTDEGAQTTVGCLRDTNMFVKEELGDYTGGNEVKEEIEEYKETPPMQPTPSYSPKNSDSTGSTPTSIPLPSGNATLVIYGKLNSEDITFIEGFLKLYTPDKQDEPKE